MKTLSKTSLDNLKVADLLGLQTVRHRGKAFFTAYVEKSGNRSFLNSENELITFADIEEVNELVGSIRPDLIIRGMTKCDDGMMLVSGRSVSLFKNLPNEIIVGNVTGPLTFSVPFKRK